MEKLLPGFEGLREDNEHFYIHRDRTNDLKEKCLIFFFQAGTGPPEFYSPIDVPKAIEHTEYMEPAAVEELLNLDKKELNDLIEKRKIPYTPLGEFVRFNKNDLMDWLREHSHKLALNGKIFDYEQLNYINLKEFDRRYLKKGASTVVQNSQRYWSYKFGGIFCRKNRKGYLKWYMQFKDIDGKWRQKAIQNAKTRKDAVEVLQQKFREVFEVKHGLRPKIKRITFSDFADKYLEDYAKVNKSSWKTDRGIVNSMKNFFGSTYLEDISSQNIEQFKAWRAKAVKKVSVNYALAVLKKMLNLTVEWSYLNPQKKPKIRMFNRVQSQKERILTPEEEKKLLQNCAPHLKPIILTALNTGMRLSEILNLKWEDVDFEKRELIVKKSKSGKMRIIPLNDEIRRVFENLPKHNTYLFNNQSTGKCYTDVSNSFATTCRRSNLKGLRFHDLRHTFATRLIAKGIDIITVKELLGHSDVGITQRYTHSQAEMKQKAVRTLSVKDLL